MKRYCNPKSELLNPDKFTPIPTHPDYLINRKGEIYDTVKGRYCKITASQKGYMQLSVREAYKGRSSRCYHLHRLLAITYLPNPDAKPCIDHINRNTLDNSLSNLRWCTRSENSQNSTKQKNATSKWMGVSWSKHSSKWVAQITERGKVKCLGTFVDELEAARVYNVAATEAGYLHINNIEAHTAPEPTPQQLQQQLKQLRAAIRGTCAALRGE